MTINSRLRNLERSLSYRETALLWLKTAQARSGYSEYWKVAEFQPWASENEEAGLLYDLVFEVNGAVNRGGQCMPREGELGRPAWTLDDRHVAPVETLRAEYGHRFLGIVAGKTLHNVR